MQLFSLVAKNLPLVISNEEVVNSTLENSDLGGLTGNIDDYFYDLDESEIPYVNSQFYRYSGLSIIEPLAFDADSDTLNFITVVTMF